MPEASTHSDAKGVKVWLYTVPEWLLKSTYYIFRVYTDSPCTANKFDGFYIPILARQVQGCPSILENQLSESVIRGSGRKGPMPT